MPRFDVNWTGFGAGLAAASLALPPLVVAGLDGDALRVAFGAVWLGVTPLAGGATGAIGWVGRRSASELLAFVPALPLVPLWLAVRAGAVAVPEWAVVGASVGALAGGLVAAVGASHAYAVALTGGETPIAVWRARASPGRRRRLFGAGALLLASPVLAGTLWLAHLLPALPVGSWSDLAIFPITTGLVLVTNARRAAEYAAYDAGIRLTYSGAVAAKLVPADRIAGYRVTDDALVIRQRGPAPDLTCALSDVEDRETVTAALDRYREAAQNAQAPTA